MKTHQLNTIQDYIMALAALAGAFSSENSTIRGN